jgi:hypothetical protein
MLIHFNAECPFAVKLYIGGINAISGISKYESHPQTMARLLTRPKQDYTVLPEQRWLDGVAVAPGVVRQLVAMPSGSK